VAEKSTIPIAILILVGLSFLKGSAPSIKGKFLTPVRGKITSRFGKRTNPVTKKSQFHNGVDLAVADATKIQAPEAGKVSSVYYTKIGGKQIVLKHKNGMKTGYAHLSKVFLDVGDQFKKGRIIGRTGSTGRVTGPHLHFTLRDKKGDFLDPAKYFSFKS